MGGQGSGTERGALRLLGREEAGEGSSDIETQADQLGC